MDDIIIVGGGIGGLTLALALHAAGIPCRIFESAAQIRAVGVGVNLLPHATRELAALGLEADLARVAIATQDATFFNRFGQLIYQEPLGRAAGYDHPQFSIHRGDLQMVLLEAFRSRAGAERILTNHHCIGLEQDDAGVSVHFSAGPAGIQVWTGPFDGPGGTHGTAQHLGSVDWSYNTPVKHYATIYRAMVTDAGVTTGETTASILARVLGLTGLSIEGIERLP